MATLAGAYYKTKYFLVLFGSAFLIWFSGETIYKTYAHPVEKMTMQQLRQKGDAFYYGSITDPAYKVMETDEMISHWYVTPLSSEGKIPLLYINSSIETWKAYDRGDSSLHPDNMPKELFVERLEELPNVNRDKIISYLNKHYPDGYIAVKEYPLPVMWLAWLALVGGIVLMYVSVKVLRTDFSSQAN